jgi:hypothetical protein
MWMMNWFDVVFMFDFNEGAKLFRLNLQADDAEQAVRSVAAIGRKVIPGQLWRAKAFPSVEKTHYLGLKAFKIALELKAGVS